MVTTHVPAWQRLGLKLKSQSLPGASGASISPTNASPTGNVFRKRKIDSDEDTVINSFDSSKRFKNNAGSVSESPASSQAGSESLSFDSRRKSVTFSADTKAEDGCSSKRLVQAAYAARLAQTEEGNGNSGSGKQRNESLIKGTDKKSTPVSKLTRMENGVANTMADAQRTSTSSSTGNETTNHADGSIDAKNSAQNKLPKKSTKQPSSKARMAKQKKKQDLAIQYLEEYATARQSWKFNKSRQVAILNMALDLDQLPTTYDEPLISYLRGLQGASSRQRLRSHAKETLASTNDTVGVTNPDDALLRRTKLVLEALGPEDQDEPILDGANKTSTETDMTRMPTENAPSKTTPNATNGIIKEQSNHKITEKQETNGTDKKRRKRVRHKKLRQVSAASDTSSSSDTESDTEDSRD